MCAPGAQRTTSPESYTTAPLTPSQSAAPTVAAGAVGSDVAAAHVVDTDKRCKSCGATVRVEIVRNEKGGTQAVGQCTGCGRRYEEEELLTLTGSAGPVGG